LTVFFFFFQTEDGIRDFHVTGVQTCALPILGANTQPEQQQEQDPFMSRQKALIVDDEPDIRELLEITLGRMKLDTRSARSLKEARDCLTRERIDLCLTDMRNRKSTRLNSSHVK